MSNTGKCEHMVVMDDGTCYCPHAPRLNNNGGCENCPSYSPIVVETHIFRRNGIFNNLETEHVWETWKTLPKEVLVDSTNFAFQISIDSLLESFAVGLQNLIRTSRYNREDVHYRVSPQMHRLLKQYFRQNEEALEFSPVTGERELARLWGIPVIVDPNMSSTNSAMILPNGNQPPIFSMEEILQLQEEARRPASFNPPGFSRDGLETDDELRRRIRGDTGFNSRDRDEYDV